MTCQSIPKKFMPFPQVNRGHKVTRILPLRWFAVAVWLIAFGLATPASAQEDLLAVFGTVKHEESNKKLQGVRVVVFQDGVEFDVISTDARGGYGFDLPLRHNYTFSFELAEHSNKRIEVDASGIPLDVNGTRNMDLDMSMMPLPPGFDASIFEDPYGRGEYSADQNTVVFDSNYTVRMRNKVNAELVRLERMAGQAEEMREKFEEFVQKGDRAKSSREWQKAVDFYDSALDLFPEESDVATKRDEAQRELDAANAANADEAAFQALLDDADRALSKDRLEEARAGFEAAKDMRPDAREPRDGLRRVDEREDALANSAEVDEEYNELVEDGDIYFEREQWDRAIDKFAEASALKPNESYPKNRMEEAQIRQADLAAQQADLIAKTIEYEALIDEANLLFRADDYAEALVKYEAAGSVLPAERFWQQRAEACRERMAEADAKSAGRRNRAAEEAEKEAAAALEREQRENYNRINDGADEAFRNSDYAAAISQYNEALAIFPDERYPKQRIAEAEKRLARAQDAAEAERNRAESESAESASEADAVAWKEADAAADAAVDDERAAREAAEAAARSEAEQVEVAYDEAIAAADEAYDRQQWTQAQRLYDDALAVKPGDRYAKSRKERAARAASNAEGDDLAQRDEGPSEADLDRERAAMEREAQREAERQNEAAEALEAQLLADQQAERDREEAKRQEQADRDRRRAEKLAQQMNSSDKDEVEAYYKAALESEAEARKQEVEEKKAAQEQLLRDAQRSAAERVDRDLQAQQDIERQGRAINEAGTAQQADRRREEEQRQATYEANAEQAQAAGSEMIQQGARETENKRRRKRRLEERRAQDYTLNVPEVEAKKRSWRNLFKGLTRTAEDRRSESRAQVENMTRRFRRLGDGANARAQERWLEARRREKKEQQLLAQREQEARQRAYNEQQAAQANLREVGPRAPEDYKLAEDDADILQGVNEQSYDIPNGLVIERTVRTGNLVVRYRKVVTKTGVYYFRGDRSITADTWRRETTVVLD